MTQLRKPLVVLVAALVAVVGPVVAAPAASAVAAPFAQVSASMGPVRCC